MIVLVEVGNCNLLDWICLGIFYLCEINNIFMSFLWCNIGCYSLLLGGWYWSDYDEVFLILNESVGDEFLLGFLIKICKLMYFFLVLYKIVGGVFWSCGL